MCEYVEKYLNFFKARLLNANAYSFNFLHSTKNIVQLKCFRINTDRGYGKRMQVLSYGAAI